MRVEDIKPDQFDVIFLVGGTGRCRTWQCIRPRKIVAAVNHRPAGLFTASRADRIVEHRYECKDRQLTGFSNEEETQAGLSGNAPWLLEDRLRIFALYRESTLDAACSRRRQPRHRSAELFGKCYCRRGSKATRRSEASRGNHLRLRGRARER